MLKYFATALNYQAYENEFQLPTTRSPNPPPDEIEKSNDETEKEPTQQSTDANTNQSKDTPPSFQKNREGHSKYSEDDISNIDTITMKTPEKAANQS